MNRPRLLRLLSERILNVQRPHPVRVAIDGVTAAGKTTLADELAVLLADAHREVIRASLDEFHNPPEIRYRLGRYSPDGYHRDAIDCGSAREFLLLPLGPNGSLRYRLGGYGQPDGSDAEFQEQSASEDAIALIDGVFLFRPELNDCWDYRIFVEVTQAIAQERALARDSGWIGSVAEARRRYQARYVPGERLYLDEVLPWTLADAVVSNDMPGAPEVRFQS